jgi:hypothetical protein
MNGVIKTSSLHDIWPNALSRRRAPRWSRSLFFVVWLCLCQLCHRVVRGLGLLYSFGPHWSFAKIIIASQPVISKRVCFCVWAFVFRRTCCRCSLTCVICVFRCVSECAGSAVVFHAFVFHIFLSFSSGVIAALMNTN